MAHWVSHGAKRLTSWRQTAPESEALATLDLGPGTTLQKTDGFGDDSDYEIRVATVGVH